MKCKMWYNLIWKRFRCPRISHFELHRKLFLVQTDKVVCRLRNFCNCNNVSLNETLTKIFTNCGQHKLSRISFISSENKFLSFIAVHLSQTGNVNNLKLFACTERKLNFELKTERHRTKRKTSSKIQFP